MSSSNKIYAMEVLSDPVIVTNFEKDVFNMIGVFSKTTILNLKADNGLNLLRNDISTIGSGTIVNNIGDSEYTLRVSSPEDSCSLKSDERGVYCAGKTAEVGIAIRIPYPLQGSQTFKWGYYSDTDGIYFLKTNTQFFVCIMRDSVEIKFEQAMFNRDRMDGTTGSYKNINFSDGNVFRINFSWYGYGSIQFSVLGIDSSGSQKMLPMHVYQTIGQTSTTHPCLPLSVNLNYGSTFSSPIAVYVAGRQFSILGSYEPIYRSNGVNTLNVVCPINIFKPIISIQKHNINQLNIRTLLTDLTIKTTKDTLIQIRSKTTLTNSSFTTIPNAETTIEYDTTADIVSSGILLWCDIIPENIHTKIHFENINIDITQVTICAKSLHPTDSSTINYVHLNWKGSW